jgi:hypothetical protein
LKGDSEKNRAILSLLLEIIPSKRLPLLQIQANRSSIWNDMRSYVNEGSSIKEKASVVMGYYIQVCHSFSFYYLI